MFPVEAAERSKEMLSHGGHPEQFPVDIRGAVSPKEMMVEVVCQFCLSKGVFEY